MVDFKKMLEESRSKDFWNSINGTVDNWEGKHIPDYHNWYKASSYVQSRK